MNSLYLIFFISIFWYFDIYLIIDFFREFLFSFPSVLLHLIARIPTLALLAAYWFGFCFDKSISQNLACCLLVWHFSKHSNCCILVWTFSYICFVTSCLLLTGLTPSYIFLVTSCLLHTGFDFFWQEYVSTSWLLRTGLNPFW